MRMNGQRSLNDLSGCRTNHPTTNMCSPSSLIIGKGHNVMTSFVGFDLGGLQRPISARSFRIPLGYVMRGRFYDSFMTSCASPMP
ncbi:hypothetical protein AVEN_35403-1 [Araneus ventricosus]|uniref:Uncharacterized protein n=1 Tax=Araneus ventricosus TaxID=182803 RepID=A0A4Y2MJF8_ARAVE|nr:hypothetical protein AVEN_35403-1 [Araneus ventricosus]